MKRLKMSLPNILPNLQRRIALIVAYDGSNFWGWQKQKTGRTVQQEIETAVGKITGETAAVAGSGRTDTGVHARGQVASFLTRNNSVSAGQFARALNAKLAYDIRILKSFEVPADFDARRHAIRRIYRYRLIAADTVDPLTRHYTYTARQPLSLSRLNALAPLFTGTHDFTAFCSAQDANHNKIRTIYKSYFVAEGAMLTYHIEGNAFLMNMVRSIVGTLLDLHSRPQGADTIISALKTGNRALCGTTAKANGLTLEAVLYPERYRPYGLPSLL
jgi:tRNA pseudouridine38-40 synthase